MHEGGYTLESGPKGELRFRNRHGLLCPSVPRSPPTSADELVARNERARLAITERTNRNGYGDPMDLADAVDALMSVIA